jgi:hypothetical protein
LFDQVRGAVNALRSDLQNAEATTNSSGALSAFNSNGFTLANGSSGSDQAILTHQSGYTYVAWNWVEGANVGFDIVSYTGNGVNGRAIAHSLGVTPAFIIVKNRDSAQSWAVWHKDLGSAIKYLVLNNNVAVASASAIFGGGANEQLPDSTNFYIGSNSMVNANNADYIAYCFAEVEGYSKAGTVTGNNSTDGPFAYLGFTPRFILYKRTSSSGHWHIWDAADRGYNPTSPLAASQAETEATRSTYYLDILSNGFKMRNTVSELNSPNGTFVYFAFAEHPFGGANVSPATAR